MGQATATTRQQRIVRIEIKKNWQMTNSFHCKTIDNRIETNVITDKSAFVASDYIAIGCRQKYRWRWSRKRFYQSKNVQVQKWCHCKEASTDFPTTHRGATLDLSSLLSGKRLGLGCRLGRCPRQSSHTWTSAHLLYVPDTSRSSLQSRRNGSKLPRWVQKSQKLYTLKTSIVSDLCVESFWYINYLLMSENRQHPTSTQHKFE